MTAKHVQGRGWRGGMLERDLLPSFSYNYLFLLILTAVRPYFPQLVSRNLGSQESGEGHKLPDGLGLERFFISRCSPGQLVNCGKQNNSQEMSELHIRHLFSPQFLTVVGNSSSYGYHYYSMTKDWFYKEPFTHPK